MTGTTLFFLAQSAGFFILLFGIVGALIVCMDGIAGIVALIVLTIFFVFSTVSTTSPLTEKQLARIYKEREPCVQVQILEAVEQKIQLTAAKIKNMQDESSKKFCAALLKDKGVIDPEALEDEYISNFYSLI